MNLTPQLPQMGNAGFLGEARCSSSASNRCAAEGRRPGPSPQLTHNSISDNDRRPASIAFHTHRQMMLTPGRPSTYAAYVQNDFGPFLCDSIGVLLQEIQNLGLVASLVATVPR